MPGWGLALAAACSLDVLLVVLARGGGGSSCDPSSDGEMLGYTKEQPNGKGRAKFESKSDSPVRDIIAVDPEDLRHRFLTTSKE